jgi:oligosaccharide repeat unit polymerase
MVVGQQSENRILVKKQDFWLFVSTALVALVYFIAFLVEYTPPVLFLISITLVYLSAIPKYLFHPKNFLFGFYGLWYTIPIMFGTRYSEYSFSDDTVVASYTMLITTYLIGFNIFHYIARKTEKEYSLWRLKPKIPMLYAHLMGILLIFAAIFLIAVMSQHGLIGWLKNPGAASQERGGSGPAIILLIFATGLTYVSGGFYLRKYKKLFLVLLLFYLALCLLTFLFYVGRARLLMYVVFLFLIPFFKTKLKLRNVLVFTFFAVSFALAASWLRGTGGNEKTSTYQKFQTSLNYFDTFEALNKVVENESPSLFQTTFYAFNKFLIPYGFDRSLPYSVSIKYTPIYFPGYGTRTTVQFPIEADMYLSGWYVLMIPLLIILFTTIAYLYRIAITTMNLGTIYVSVSLLFLMISHLRGMLIEFYDFYMFPILLVSYFLLNPYREHGQSQPT